MMNIHGQNCNNSAMEVKLPGLSGLRKCVEMGQQEVQPSSCHETSWLEPKVSRAGWSILRKLLKNKKIICQLLKEQFDA